MKKYIRYVYNEEYGLDVFYYTSQNCSITFDKVYADGVEVEPTFTTSITGENNDIKKVQIKYPNGACADPLIDISVTNGGSGELSTVASSTTKNSLGGGVQGGFNNWREVVGLSMPQNIGVNAYPNDPDFENAWVANVEPESTWTAGAFSEFNGFANCIAFYENRLIFGGNFTQPNTIWISKTNDYNNFTTGVRDTDSLRLTLNSLTDNEIKWLIPTQNLIVGTSNSEWTLGSDADNLPITPTRFSLKERSQFGSNNIKGKFVADSILFITNSGRKVREWNFNYFTLESDTPELTLLSEHITKSGITDAVYQQEPDNILWLTKENGELLGLTYDKSQKVYAWHRHQLGNSIGAYTEFVNRFAHYNSLKEEITGDYNNDEFYFNYNQSIVNADDLKGSLFRDFEIEVIAKIEKNQSVPMNLKANRKYGTIKNARPNGNYIVGTNQLYSNKNAVAIMTPMPNDPF